MTLHNSDIEPLLPPIDQYPDLFQPIPIYLDDQELHPNGSVDDWRGSVDTEHRIDIQDNLEELVNVSSLNSPIFSTSDYTAKLDNSGYQKPLDGTVLSQYVRKSVAERLSEAQRQLPDEYRLIIYDGWRSLETQLAAYSMCFNSIVEMLIETKVLPSHNISPEVRELISLEAQKYIALPSPMPPVTKPTSEEVEEGRNIPSPHNTGGSVDVAIVRIDDEVLDELKHLEELLADTDDQIKRAQLNFEFAAIYRLHATLPDFGTGFDFAGQESALTHCESDSADESPKYWRRMLYNVMTRAGFEPYSEEWWHFNFGNQPAERTKWLRTGKKGTVVYGNTSLTAEQKKFEQLHTILFEDLVRASQTKDKASFRVNGALAQLGVNTAQLLEVSERIGDPRKTRSLGNPHDIKYRGTLPDEFIQSIKDRLADEA